ncbi:MAG: hypothetical protein ACRDTH_22145 [Pseudonocardiaceae bacterium]
MATTRNDKMMYIVLVTAIVTGLATTLLGAGVLGEQHSYRETVLPCFRSAGARVHCTGWVAVAALHRLPVAGRRTCHARGAPRLGTDRATN